MAVLHICRSRMLFVHARLMKDGLRSKSESYLGKVTRPPSRSQHTSSTSSHLPRLMQPSIWQSIIPKAIRDRGDKAWFSMRTKTRNPATYFIWIYLFIGSQAIRIITVQNEFNTFMRKAEVKIGKLRDVVEKLQKGEPVDVERVLGTGDEIEELEWEEALKQIENEDRIWQSNRRRRKEEREKLAAKEEDASPVHDPVLENGTTKAEQLPTGTPIVTKPGFY